MTKVPRSIAGTALCVIAVMFLLPSFNVPAADALNKSDVEFFEKNIRPLLAEKCCKCHSAELGKSKGALTLDTRAGWLRGGEGGPAIVPGKPDASLLIKAISWTDADLKMPPKKEGGKLTDA